MTSLLDPSKKIRIILLTLQLQLLHDFKTIKLSIGDI
jgi:hypothetical protein